MTAESIKQDLLAAAEDPAAGGSVAASDRGAAITEWRATKKAFFETCNQFIYNDYEQAILEAVGDDEETAEYVRELFANVRSQADRLAVIRNKAAVLENSVCVIGADATSMTDYGITPYEENFPNVGTYGVAANMILSEDFLDDAPFYVSAIIALIFSLVLGFLMSRFDTGTSIVTGITGILFLTGAFAAFFVLTRIYIGFAVPLVSSGITFVSLMVMKFLSASREKTFLHGAFSRYLAPSVINEIIANPSKLNLGGEQREMTVMFTDIEGFSGISEQLQDPAKLVNLLNLYLTAMSTIIMENLGTIDKYEGDAIIAFFGAPIHHQDHAIHACRSALAIKKTEAELNGLIMRENMSPYPLFTRIGVNTGEMVVGNMGAENKMDYTIMGNSVNLASRLEGINKQYRTGGILISEYTRAKIGDEFLCHTLDRVRVVGVNTPLRLYELVGLKTGAIDHDLERIASWESAMELLEQRRFSEAEKSFSSMAKSNTDDRTAALYAERCRNYMSAPPGDDWDGVYNLTEK
jgi:adenylate cyclase